MSTVLAVGPEPAVADLVRELRRGTYHGLAVVAACLGGVSTSKDVAGVPVFGGLAVDDVVSAVRRSGADTVAVLSSSELDARHAPTDRVGAGEDGHRPVRRARAA